MRETKANCTHVYNSPLIAELQRLYALATRPEALQGESGRSVPERREG